MDEVNLYSLQNTNYYVWPVVVINRNIPQWLSMKNEHIMLALIVLGRRQVKRMDVYIQTLIDEFNQLWEGIYVYDVSRPIPMERYLTLYGICVYTTHDYLGLEFSLVSMFINLFVSIILFGIIHLMQLYF
jgi:hypothetical protein